MGVRRYALVPAAVIIASMLALAPVLAGGPATDSPAAPLANYDYRAALQQAARSDATVDVIVRLQDPAIAERLGTGGRRRLSLTSAAAREYGARLAARQERFLEGLRTAAPSARVLNRYSVVLNGMALRISGRDISRLQRMTGVRSVTLSREFTPTMNVSVHLINAPSIWKDLGGGEQAGAGVRVAIIDTGIDNRSRFFDDSGYEFPDGFPKVDNPGNMQYTSKKIIVARSYPRDSGKKDSAKDTNGHGTHVAGTAAGNFHTRADVRGVHFRLSGVAPRAYLGNYNVFPDHSPSTSDGQIVAALEGAVRDDMHVVNMSIGGGSTPPPDEDPAVAATNATVRAGLVVAVAAGNSGPFNRSVTSPGTAERAITAGASTNPHFVGQPVSVTGPGSPPPDLQNLGGAVGSFNAYSSTTEAEFVWWGALAPNDLACEPLSGDPLAGKLALISRGICSFTTKIRNAEDAGAIGAIVFNNVAGDPIAMGHDGTDPFPQIPAVMVSRDEGFGMRDWYKAHPDDSTARINAEFEEFVTENADIIAGFSSRGPTRHNELIKPDVAAPGVNILSSFPGGHVFAFLQGTSMASPHVAGAAALLRHRWPDWSPQQVKSALVVTGKRPVWDSFTGDLPTGANTRGGGRIDLARAKAPGAAFDPASLSFGTIPPGSTVTMKITATGVSGGGTWSVHATDPTRPGGNPSTGVRVRVEPSNLTLADGESATLTVTVLTGAGAGSQHEGDIVLNGTTRLRLPYWMNVKP